MSTPGEVPAARFPARSSEEGDREAWTMRPFEVEPFEVEHVGTVVTRAPGFAEAAKAAGLDPAKVVAELDAMTFAERAVLVHQAVQTQAPTAVGSDAGVSERGESSTSGG